MNTPCSPSLRSFTLIELMAALGLSSLLILGLLGVIGLVADPARDPTLGGLKEGTTPAPLAAWIELLRHDLAHAQTMRAGENSLELRGYGGIAPDTRSVTHRPVRITYESRRAAGHHWIVRKQEALDEPTNFNTHSELVCGGIQRWLLIREEGLTGLPGAAPFGPSLGFTVPLSPRPETTPLPGRGPPAIPGSRTSGPVPDRLILMVQADGADPSVGWTHIPLVLR